ncbi:MAG: VapC toxin family PIN domain ribonuclease, partial [Myxococcales bacterium]|nr:VapC toxin family PIN domain ribonuclease [Myxococcales bacterium]
RRFVLKGFLPESSALYAMEDLRDLPLIRHGHGPFLERAFALRENATIYDALYLALAEALEAPLLTADAALAKVPGHGAAVEVLA